MPTMTSTHPVRKATGPWPAQFERLSGGPTWLRALRKAGLARFSELGFPSTKLEDWRFTNVQPIARLPFKPALDADASGVLGKRVGLFPFGGLDAIRLVFVNGHFAPELSTAQVDAPGVFIGNLASALETQSDRLEKWLGGCSSLERENAFLALNTAFIQDGAVIILEPNQTLEKPVQLVYLVSSAENGSTFSPRNLIVAGANSRATVLECFHSLVDVPYFTNAVTEFVLGEGAHLEHCKFQEEAPSAFHMASLDSRLARHANFISHSFALGARLSRNNINTLLDGTGVECVLNGLYLTSGEQLADHHMVVDHAQPSCASHEYFNGILDDNSRGVFHGRILVRPGAQKTDAKQTNKNLLLSDSALVHTKPQLEIYADDVKCTHGATIGQLDEAAIFYLRARGLSEDTAQRMLIHAFAGEIIDRIRYQPLREEMDALAWDRLETNARIAMKA
jgi:Fe-S cluster assembly protein SufD